MTLDMVTIAVFAFVLVIGPLSVVTMPTTTEPANEPVAPTDPPTTTNPPAPTDPPATTNSPATTNPPAPTDPQIPEELLVELDTIKTIVDRQNTWLETLQDDVNSLADAVELHSLDLYKLRKKVGKVHKGDKSSSHSSEEGNTSSSSEEGQVDTEESFLDSFENLWSKESSKSSSMFSDILDEEDFDLFRIKDRNSAHSDGMDEGTEEDTLEEESSEEEEEQDGHHWRGEDNSETDEESSEESNEDSDDTSQEDSSEVESDENWQDEDSDESDSGSSSR